MAAGYTAAAPPRASSPHTVAAPPRASSPRTVAAPPRASSPLFKLPEVRYVSDPGVTHYPSGSSVAYTPSYTLLSAGDTVRMSPPKSDWSNPTTLDHTATVVSVDPTDPATPYTVDMNGAKTKMHLNPYSGVFTTDSNTKGYFIPKAEESEDFSKIAFQVLKELREDDKLSNPYAQIAALVNGAAPIFMQEAPLQEIYVEDDETCAIFGDIHGNFRCMKNLLAYRPKGKSKFVFLGDFVDRGSHQIEVVAYLLAKKILHPHGWYLIRGNHEDMALNARHGFEHHCVERLGLEKGKSLHSFVNSLFNVLPLAAIVQNSVMAIFCCHGGIGPDMMTGRDAFKAVQKPCCISCDYSEALAPWERIVKDLTWSDVREPEELAKQGKQFDVCGFCSNENARGKGTLCWGPEATRQFLQAMNCNLIVRGHDPSHAPTSMRFDHDGKVLTIFSSTPYMVGQWPDGRCISNEGAVMIKIQGGSNALHPVKIDQFHRRIQTGEKPPDVETTNTAGDLVVVSPTTGERVIIHPALADLAKVASSEPEPETPTHAADVPAGKPVTISELAHGQHVLVGNIEGKTESSVRSSPNGPVRGVVEDGTVVVVRKATDDRLWVEVVTSGGLEGWIRYRNIHQQKNKISMKDVSCIPGLRGAFALKAGMKVLIGITHVDGHGQVMVSPLRDGPAGQPIPGQSVTDDEFVNVEGRSTDNEWVLVSKGALRGWTRVQDVHVQAASQAPSQPAVKPFLPLDLRYVIFGCVQPENLNTEHPLLTIDGKASGQTVKDGEVVQITQEGGMGSVSMVEISTLQPPNRHGWVGTCNIHVQIKDLITVPSLEKNFSKFIKGKRVAVGVTHKEASQCSLRDAPNSPTPVAMVVNGEEVEVRSITPDGLWSQVCQLHDSNSVGWIITQSLHVQA